MKTGEVPGDFAFKGLVRVVATEDSTQQVWFPTQGYFFTKEEIEHDFPPNKFEIKWPIEIQEHGIVYVPAESELE